LSDSFQIGTINPREGDPQMTERLKFAVLLAAAKLARRLFTRVARGGMTAELLLQAAGVDVDRLVAESQPVR
jgi:hypothetical protein